MATISANPGQQIQFQPAVIGTQPIVYSLQDAPAWLNINAQSGLVTGIVPAGQAAGPVTFKILAQNCYAGGQFGNSATQNNTINVTISCVPISIVDPGDSACIPVGVVAPSQSATITQGQTTTTFEFALTGSQPFEVLSQTGGAIVVKINNNNYKLVIASGSLTPGSYVYNVRIKNCSGVEQIKSFTVTVGGSGSSGGQGGGGCTLQITAPSSIAKDQPLNYTVGMSAGGGCTAYQTWLLNNDQVGGTSGTGSVSGQNDPQSPTALGQYSQDLTNLNPGEYEIWAKCNDGGSCNNSWAQKPLTILAAGQTGGGGTGPCTGPTYPGTSQGDGGNTYSTFTLPVPQGLMHNVNVLIDGTQPISVTATHEGGAAPGATYPISWVGSNIYRVEFTNSQYWGVGTQQIRIRATNCGGQSTRDLVLIMNVQAPAGGTCTPVGMTQPNSSSISGNGLATASSSAVLSGTGPFTATTDNPSAFATVNGTTLTLGGTFDATVVTNVLVTVYGCGGSAVSKIWTINGQGGS